MDPGPKTVVRASRKQNPMKLEIPESFMTTANHSDDGKSETKGEKSSIVT